jgi:hypothetical protein
MISQNPFIDNRHRSRLKQLGRLESQLARLAHPYRSPAATSIVPGWAIA